MGCQAILAMPDWKTHGIRIVRAGDLDSNTPQTPGMTRAAAITHASAGAKSCGRAQLLSAPLRARPRITTASWKPCSTS